MHTETALELMKNHWVLDRFKQLKSEDKIAPFYMSKSMWQDRERYRFPYEFIPEENNFFGRVLGDEDELWYFSLDELTENNVEFHREEKTHEQVEKWNTLTLVPVPLRHHTILVYGKSFTIGHFGDGTILECSVDRSKRNWYVYAHLSRAKLKENTLPDWTKYQTKSTMLYNRLRGTCIPGIQAGRSWNKEALKVAINKGYQHAVNHFGTYGFNIQIA